MRGPVGDGVWLLRVVTNAVLFGVSSQQCVIAERTASVLYTANLVHREAEESGAGF